MIQNNLHIVLNEFTNDSRVLKITKTISSLNVFECVYVAALFGEGLSVTETIVTGGDDWSKRQIDRFSLLSRKIFRSKVCLLIKYMELSWKIFFRYKRENVTVVHCHDLEALPIGMLFKLFKKSNVVYDAHELETEQFSYQNKFTKFLAKILEKVLIKYIDAFITVSPSICDWYIQNYNKRLKVEPILLRNVPESSKVRNEHLNKQIFRKKFNIGEDDTIYLYQGGMTLGRGIERLLWIFEKLDSNKHIVFMGYGVLCDQIKVYAARCKNIHYHEAVATDVLLNYTSSADVGVCLIEDCNLSYRYSLPNKMFEYISAYLPVIINGLPDQKEIIEKYACGWVASESNSELVSFISEQSKNEINTKAEKARLASEDLCWKNEERELALCYTSQLIK